jgi:hypothetical protein
MRRFKTILTASFSLLVLAAGSLPGRADAASAPAAPSAQAFYVAALGAMRELPQPTYVSYRLEGQGDALQITLTQIRGLVWLYFEAGSTPSHWTMRHRTDDYETEVVNSMDEHRYVTQRSFFDPTWYGSYRALRDGMLGYQDVEAPVSSHPTPIPDPPTTLKTIAVESVMGPGIYAVQDRGSAACSNGDPGHALHLTSRSHDPKHQLTDVIVDLHSMRFCMIRYSWPSAFGFHGVVEQYYAEVGGYWMETGGTIDGTLRAFGIATHHGIWHYRLTDMQFPKSIPAEAFVPNLPT